MNARSFAPIAGWIVVLCSLPFGPVSAQIPQLSADCDLQSYRVLTSQEVFPGRRVTWIGRPVLVCPDGAQVQADSAVLYEETARTEFIGQVHFRNIERELRSSRADYYEREARLVARGDVELFDLIQGSEIRGDSLEILQANHLRPGDWLTMTGGPPTAVFHGSIGAGGDRAPEPYHVTGNRLRFEDDRYLWAEGNGVIEQGELRASADSVFFDQEGGDLRLTGQARLDQAGSELEGHRIQVVLADQQLQTITALEQGRITTSDLIVTGEYLRLFFANGEMERLVAVHRTEDATEVAPPRPQILADEFSLEADSLDVDSPEGRLELVTAIGRARGESLGRGLPAQASTSGEDEEAGEGPEEEQDGEQDEDAEDGAEQDAEEDAEEDGEQQAAQDEGEEGAEQDGAGEPTFPGPDIADRDWIEGDEILAFFATRPATRTNVAENDVAEDDVAEDDVAEDEVGENPETQAEAVPPEYVLDRLVATGSARTLYRSLPEERETGSPQPAAEPPSDGRWAFSYVLAEEITVFLLEGGVNRIEAVGDVRGVQLDPAALGTTPPETAEGESVNEGEIVNE